MESNSASHTPLGRWLERASATPFAAYCIGAAFGTYFCMYAFRKPFTAGTYEDASWLGIDYKTVLIVAQVLGYAVSKFIGVKVISEMPAHRRAAAIVGLIGLAQLALLAFALLPRPYNAAALFLNGLPLGMIFGLVLAFLEGRQLTEALAAGLCASFIVSSGVVKSVGRMLIERFDVSEYWMPFWTGMLFLPPLLASVWLLKQIPAPNRVDVAERSPRSIMSRRDRWHFFRKYAAGISLLVIVYVALTVVRSIRDDFAVEIWRDLGAASQPEVFAKSEALVMLAVLLINGAAVLIRSNRKALFVAIGSIIAGFALVMATITAFNGGRDSPFMFMVLTGVGLYIPYVAFHTTIFERLLAATRDVANIGFLMYLADSAGYLGYVAVVLFRAFAAKPQQMLPFFLDSSYAGGVICLVGGALAVGYFAIRLPREAAVVVKPAPAAVAE